MEKPEGIKFNIGDIVYDPVAMPLWKARVISWEQFEWVSGSDTGRVFTPRFELGGWRSWVPDEYSRVKSTLERYE